MKSFKEAFNLITTAYINNTLNPYNGCQCFIGNLFDNSHFWENFIYRRTGGVRDNSPTPKGILGGYSPKEIEEMEYNFLTTIRKELGISISEYTSNLVLLGDGSYVPIKSMEGYEDALFKAMESTLDILKNIHISRGENVDEISFQKRVLV